MDYEVIIIGGGQAGLSAGYYLKACNLSFQILEKAGTIGQVWQDRYDSLELFTPREYSSLPGYPFPAIEGNYPTKTEVAAYLQAYATHFQLPVELNSEVISLQADGDGFRVDTAKIPYRARRVIVATGPFQRPLIPTYPGQLQSPIFQLHSSQYRNPAQLPQGPALVVGGGNSGAQIAVELSGSRQTFLSVRRKIRFKSLSLLGKSIFWWGTRLGILYAPSGSWMGQFLRRQGDPVYGNALKQRIANKKVVCLPEIESFEGEHICLANGQKIRVSSLIWSTGFRPDYSWIKVPQLFDAKGQLRHRKGVSLIEGLYFLGLSWQRSRSSALLLGAGRDARFITEHIRKKQ